MWNENASYTTYPCTNPRCEEDNNFARNALGIVAEYLTVAYFILVLSAALSRVEKDMGMHMPAVASVGSCQGPKPH